MIGKISDIMGDVSHGLMVVVAIRKKVEKAIKGKPVISIPSCPLNQFLTPDSNPV